ncbi:MAG: COG3650 family protein [Novosphingobium sp.]
MRSALVVAAMIGLAACGKQSESSVDLPLKPSDAATMPAAPAPDPAQPTPVAVATPDEAATKAPTPAPAASATPAPPPEKHFRAVGTEPFWNVDVLPKARLKYSNPDMVNGVIVSAVERRKGGVVRYTARLNGRPFVLTLEPGKCSDGMSDMVYNWKASLLHAGRTDHGCARLK